MHDVADEVPSQDLAVPGLFEQLAGRHGENSLARAAVRCAATFLLQHGADAYTQVPQVRAH